MVVGVVGLVSFCVLKAGFRGGVCGNKEKRGEKEGEGKRKKKKKKTELL